VRLRGVLAAGVGARDALHADAGNVGQPELVRVVVADGSRPFGAQQHSRNENE